jgi:translation initiation factor IF-3
VLPKEVALQEAEKRGLDLVEIAPEVNPPVAKILDFSKFLYDEKKKKSSSKSKKSELKELRFGPNTGESDMKRHAERSREFIEDGDQVRLTVQMRGRENLHPELAFEKLDEVIEALSDAAKPEQEPKRMGSRISVTLVKK